VSRRAEQDAIKNLYLRLGTEVGREETQRNLSKISLKMSEDLRERFKREAEKRGLSEAELSQISFYEMLTQLSRAETTVSSVSLS
jgi:ribosome-binding protein aMBF1 (putative translation factor)